MAMKAADNIRRGLQNKDSEHKNVVGQLSYLYEQIGKEVIVERQLNGQFIDVQVTGWTDRNPVLIEVEIESSVNWQEAGSQWSAYAQAYDHWWLAVPNSCVAEAERLLRVYCITNCGVIAWWPSPEGYEFHWLPGLEQQKGMG